MVLTAAAYLINKPAEATWLCVCRCLTSGFRTALRRHIGRHCVAYLKQMAISLLQRLCDVVLLVLSVMATCNAMAGASLAGLAC